MGRIHNSRYTIPADIVIVIHVVTGPVSELNHITMSNLHLLYHILQMHNTRIFKIIHLSLKFHPKKIVVLGIIFTSGTAHNTYATTDVIDTVTATFDVSCILSGTVSTAHTVSISDGTVSQI